MNLCDLRVSTSIPSAVFHLLSGTVRLDVLKWNMPKSLDGQVATGCLIQVGCSAQSLRRLLVERRVDGGRLDGFESHSLYPVIRPLLGEACPFIDIHERGNQSCGGASEWQDRLGQ